jgi:hypothetical protein
MNEIPLMSDDELRLATSRSLPGDVALDAEVAAAREAFLSLGGALESAGSEFDEAALIQRLHAACLIAPKPSAKYALPERTTERRWWPLLVSGVLAAGLAGLFFILGGTNDDSQPIAVTPELQKPSETHASPNPPIDLRVARNTVSEDTAEVAQAWSDPLDDEISLAAATIGQLAGHERGLDYSLLEINDRLEALVQELNSETL